MNIKTFTASFIAAFAILSAAEASAYAVKTADGQEDLKEFRDAVRLYGKGMTNRSRTLFDAMSDKDAKADYNAVVSITPKDWAFNVGFDIPLDTN